MKAYWMLLIASMVFSSLAVVFSYGGGGAMWPCTASLISGMMFCSALICRSIDEKK